MCNMLGTRALRRRLRRCRLRQGDWAAYSLPFAASGAALSAPTLAPIIPASKSTTWRATLPPCAHPLRPSTQIDRRRPPTAFGPPRNSSCTRPFVGRVPRRSDTSPASALTATAVLSDLDFRRNEES
jgi:hypothetical protein